MKKVHYLSLLIAALLIFLCSCSSGDDKIGKNTARILVSYGSDNIEAYYHELYAQTDGVAYDCAKPDIKELFGSLPAFTIKKDGSRETRQIKVELEGKHGEATYSIWNKDIKQTDIVKLQDNKIPIPSESGDYLFQLDVTWLGEGQNCTGVNYLFKITVE